MDQLVISSRGKRGGEGGGGGTGGQGVQGIEDCSAVIRTGSDSLGAGCALWWLESSSYVMYIDAHQCHGRRAKGGRCRPARVQYIQVRHGGKTERDGQRKKDAMQVQKQQAKDTKYRDDVPCCI